MQAVSVDEISCIFRSQDSNIPEVLPTKRHRCGSDRQKFAKARVDIHYLNYLQIWLRSRLHSADLRCGMCRVLCCAVPWPRRSLAQLIDNHTKQAIPTSPSSPTSSRFTAKGDQNAFAPLSASSTAAHAVMLSCAVAGQCFHHDSDAFVQHIGWNWKPNAHRNALPTNKQAAIRNNALHSTFKQPMQISGSAAKCCNGQAMCTHN